MKGQGWPQNRGLVLGHEGQQRTAPGFPPTPQLIHEGSHAGGCQAAHGQLRAAP